MDADLRRRRLLRSSAALLAAVGLVGQVPEVALAQSAEPTATPGLIPATPPVLGPSASGPELGPRGVLGGEGELPAWVKPRETWAAAGPVQAYVPHTPTHVSVHHTGAPWNGRPSTEQALRNIQAFHIGPEREWEDIAYHFLVDLEGGIWAGRPPTVRGNPSVYYNSMGYVLICLLGDYNVQEPSEAQIAAVTNTAAWLIRRFNLPTDAITGHRDHAPTSCPGTNLYRLVQEQSLARRVQALLK